MKQTAAYPTGQDCMDAVDLPLFTVTTGKYAANVWWQLMASTSDNSVSRSTGGVCAARRCDPFGACAPITSELRLLAFDTGTIQHNIVDCAFGVQYQHRSSADVVLPLVRHLVPRLHRSGSMIRTQPTAAARRKPGITRGAKRPCKLAYNIEHNVAHAKSHGTGH